GVGSIYLKNVAKHRPRKKCQRELGMATATERVQGKAQRATSGGFHTLTGVQMLAIGAFAPEEIVRNQDLAELGYDEGWIVQRTGIRERRRAPANMASSDVALEASRRCLEKAGLTADDIGLILVATTTPDTPIPSTACHLQRLLGAKAPAMDLNAACSGFVFALVTAAQYVKTGFCQNALVVGVDLMTRLVNPEDHKTFPLFGDGAGAALVGPGNAEQGFLAYTLGSDGKGADMLHTPAGGTREPLTAESLAKKRQFLQMEGRLVFRWAVRMVADSIVDVLQEARVAPNELDLIALHQANIRIIDAVVDDLDVDRDKVFVNVDRYGNTSAASIPLVLDEAHAQGRISAGDMVMMSGFGAGLTWGTALFRW
ncbi:MAG: beta-ketoacyl-ACP synthase III, partial [Pirellulaceae bacterium]